MKLLDLYSGAGIAAIGYKQAGFHVTGIDIEKKSCYAGDIFLQANALDVLADTAFCSQFDAIHSSPPCQKYSRSTAPQRARGKEYADLIAPTRILLEKIGLPYVIENVPTAPIRPDIKLMGHMFGLRVIRKRHFELGNWFMMQPSIPLLRGSVKAGDYCTIIGKAGYKKDTKLPNDWRPCFDQGTIIKTWTFAMGIPSEYKFKDVEISESFPPAYSKYIGEELINYIKYKQ